jgi:NAD(P)-dependent dehydrogenase (short-subunit alcohol dehydrogenase family)
MKNVLITGAGGGMGRAAVDKFSAEGWRVFALDKRLCDGGENIIPIEADVTDEESVKRAFISVWEHTDSLDAIVHFAGIYMLDSLVEMSDEAF